ncbi:MAG: rod shape-determining protein MreC [Clostridia bacterium]|nr:rod shape-determining protein MreC [Clostridia bacterium]
MYKDDKNGKIGFFITILILIFLVIFTNLDQNILGKLSSPFVKISRSAQNGFTNLSNKMKGNEEYFSSLESVKKQYEDLKREYERLESENQKLVVLEAENKTLKEQLNLAENYKEYETIPGYVIQKDFSNYSKVLVINLGSEDGIQTGMTVVAERGLVGYVVSVESNSSKVQTIVDTASVVSGFISNSEKSLVARGLLDTNERIKGTYIDNDVVINEGDSITTSGLGGIYPKNIIIGKVGEIVNTQNKTNRYVYIDVAVDFNNLSNIIVIKNK